MSAALERALFLLAQCRLLLLEIEDVERQLRELSAVASAPEKSLLEEGIEALKGTVEASRSARFEIGELVSVIETESEEKDG